ncbi:MAG: peptide chain release factor N(5)-glutamine methyltransferase [Thermoleophilaceae bacterium]
MNTLASATLALARAGCEAPQLDAQLLLCEALGIDRTELLISPPPPLAPAHAARFKELLARRIDREPVAYILGRRAFRRIELIVDPRVLIPRPDTETLVEAALTLPPGARVHDVGTGSGAVALAIKDERPDLVVSGSDVSAGAVALARINAARLGLEVELRHAAGVPAGDHDLVVANLPYVAEAELPLLAPEIARFEPRLALLGGRDGLDAIRALVAEAGAGARLALEHAPDQAGAVRSMLEDALTLRDLSGRERVTVGLVPERPSTVASGS